MPASNDPEHERICEAYLQMAERANFRPYAPGDGMGNTELSPSELRDSNRLAEEASAYAEKFIAEENTRKFHIGVSNFETNRAFVYLIEACRCLCAGASGEPVALDLLQMAVDEIKTRRRKAQMRA
jgi:hypothetical protein